MRVSGKLRTCKTIKARFRPWFQETVLKTGKVVLFSLGNRPSMLCIYICIYVHINIYIYIYINTYICVYRHTYIERHIYIETDL